MHSIESPANRERFFLAIAGCLQGLAAWIIIRIDPKEPLDQALFFSILAWFVSSGLLFQFASTGVNHRRLAGIVTLLGIPFSLVTYHVIAQMPPHGFGHNGDGYRVATWCGAAILSLYIILPYLQIYQHTGRLVFPYSDLYRHSWNNFFLAVLGGFYTGVYWALVWTCSGLFKALGIDAIQDIISNPSFSSITTGIISGIGVALAKEHAKIITTLRNVSATLFRSLMPLLVIIVLSFLATLPFTSLTPLWGTKWASSILLALLLLILLFVNAVFQDGESEHYYGSVFRRGVEAILIGMPILVGLTLYSMHLRIAQYGFTPERYYVVIFAIVLSGYSAGYAWSTLKGRPQWLGSIRLFNVALSFVVLGVAFALHSPLMDPLKRSAEDQERRLLSGQVHAAHFDFGTMRFELGHYGQAVLDRLAQAVNHPEHQQITIQLARLQKANSEWEWEQSQTPPLSSEEVLAKLRVFPPNHVVPEDLLSNLSTPLPQRGCSTTHPCDIVAGQWGSDGDLEYVVINGCGHAREECNNYTVALYDRTGDKPWKEIASLFIGGKEKKQFSRQDTLLAAKEGRLSFAGVQYHCMSIESAHKVCDSWGKEIE